MFDQIDFSPGKIIYNDFEYDKNKKFDDQKFNFKEDLLQVEYRNEIIIDIGWYPEFSPSGHFIVYIIKNSDWENPIQKNKFYNVDQLKVGLCKIINTVRELIN